MFQKNRQNRLGGDAEKALERNLLHVKHNSPLPLLDFTLVEVLDNLFNSNKTRIPRLWKCFRRVRLTQL